MIRTACQTSSWRWVERAHGEADGARGTERTEQAVVDEGFADRPGAGVAEGYVPAPVRVSPWGVDPHAEGAAPLVQERDEGLGQRLVLPGHVFPANLAPDLGRRGEDLVRDDRRGAGEVPGRSRVRLVLGEEPIPLRMTHPAGDGGPGASLVRRVHVQERGAARPAAQVLVAAPDREVRPGAREVHVQRAGGVGEVPDREGAGGPGRVRSSRQDPSVRSTGSRCG